jgi:hypothetical protein
VEYDGLRLHKISKINDDKEISPPPFSVLYVEVRTAGSAPPPSFSYGSITYHQQSADNPITSISVRYQKYESVLFQGPEEKKVLEKLIGCAALSAAFKNGINAFGMDETGSLPLLMPVLKLSYSEIISEVSPKQICYTNTPVMKISKDNGKIWTVIEAP